MPIFSIEGRLGIFKGRSNISTNKYYISILPGTLFIRSSPSFGVKYLNTKSMKQFKFNSFQFPK